MYLTKKQINSWDTISATDESRASETVQYLNTLNRKGRRAFEKAMKRQSKYQVTPDTKKQQTYVSETLDKITNIVNDINGGENNDPANP